MTTSRLESTKLDVAAQRVARVRVPIRLAAIVLVIVGCIGAPDASAGSQSPQHSERVTRLRDSWMPYRTSVMPGDEIGLGSVSAGLSLLGEPTNGLDGNLSAPGGVIVSWPSSGVLVTTDGARRWRTSLSERGGFWDLDVLDAERAWAVGVTSLYRTVTGGLSWQEVGEPSQALVRVAFANPSTGFGLTVKGVLVESHDSGASWEASRWSGRVEALCAPAPRVLIIADIGGGIWRSGDGGIRWRQAAPDLAKVDGFSPWYSDLSCQGANGVEVSRTFCEATLSTCGSKVISRVRQSTNLASGWRVRMAQAAASRLRTTPSSALDVPLVRAVAVGSDGLCLVGVPYLPPASAEIKCSTHMNEPFTSSALPGLPFRPSQSTVVVQGIEFLNPRVGWLLVDEYTTSRTGSPSGSEAKTEIWATHDGGRRWLATYRSPSYPGRWCSNQRTSTCWR
jgi:hypothetical protein